MKAYLDLCRRILDEGVRKANRTGVDTIGVSGAMFQHDMQEGFPLLTTKKTAYKHARSEMEFFIKGITDKRWLQERGNHIWDEWCNPKIVSYGHDAETQDKMKAERDLGPIYGFQWRHLGAEYCGPDTDYSGKGIDQLAGAIDKLKTNPTDRRNIVTAWAPADLDKMALPPCHYGFQLLSDGETLDLLWNQRSVDVPLGLPFNIAGYATLLHLIAKEVGMREGTLTGFLADTHIYENQVGGIEEQLSRKPKKLSRVETEDFSSTFDWNFMDTKLVGYESHPPIKFPLAV